MTTAGWAAISNGNGYYSLLKAKSYDTLVGAGLLLEPPHRFQLPVSGTGFKPASPNQLAVSCEVPPQSAGPVQFPPPSSIFTPIPTAAWMIRPTARSSPPTPRTP